MRKELQKIENTRAIFTGTFIRFGQKRGYRHPQTTVLLQDVKNAEGKIITDHLWFNYTKEFQRLWEKESLHTGHPIQFSARVKCYTKGYEKDQWDYRLSHPTKLSIIGKVHEAFRNWTIDPPYKYLQDFFFYTHPYFKLDKPTYTTIRGLDALEYYELNQIVSAKLHDGIYHTAQILKIQTRSLSAMSLDFLRADCEYPGFTLYSKVDFVDLINSFRRNPKSHVTVEQDPSFAVFTNMKLWDKLTNPNIIPKPKPVSSLDKYFGAKLS